ncbi:MAG: type III pantothenate kinase [Anaerolineaceae bacterium]|nr:MAG: type III pantothenate kinase [Anaerolineaceae bacterium]
MLLAIDIGNTNITLGVWDGRFWQREWRLHTARERTADEFGILLSGLLQEAQLDQAITGVVLASVVPALTGTFQQLCEQVLRKEALVVNAQTDTGIQIRTDNPAEVGADRIVNAVAAFHLFQGPCIVIDMGTATTFDVISATGELLGVVIAPGLRLAADALIDRAAQLSQVPLQAPPQATGRNTIHAMQSGLIFGYVSLIEGMIQRLLQEHPDKAQKINIIGTGGLIKLITPHTTIIDHVDPWLTLTGLRVISERVNL